MGKKPISATIDEGLIDWIEFSVRSSEYRNKSHLIEIALEKYRQEKENGTKNKKLRH